MSFSIILFLKYAKIMIINLSMKFFVKKSCLIILDDLECFGDLKEIEIKSNK